MTTNWTEKYRPKYFSDVYGQEQAVEALKTFIKKHGRAGEKKAAVLHGPPGIGKTTLVHVAASESSSEIFEMNASDLRDREKMKQVLRPVTEQKSLLKRNKIILIDEVDGISGVDRGGLSELIKLVEITSYPMILTANDIWDKKFADLRKKTELIQLKEVNYGIIKNIMIDILRREKKFIDSDILTNIAIKAKGDIRAALNDLQTAASMKDPSQILIDERNKNVDIFSAMRMIFKGKPNNTMLKLFDSVDKPIDEILLWIEENIPAEYSGTELAKAYDALSRVDIFRKRIFRQQYWRFLVYENALLSYAVSASKKTDSSKTGFTSYKRPTRVLKIWLNNQKTEAKKSIAKKYSNLVHIGEKRALRDFSMVKLFFMNPEIQKELKLTEKEIEYLNKN